MADDTLADDTAAENGGDPGPQSLSDEELVERARTGQSDANEAVATLYRRHFNDSVNILTANIRDRNLAEESVAEAFARILEQIREGRGPTSNFKAYLRKASYSRAIDQLRKDARDVTVSGQQLNELLEPSGFSAHTRSSNALRASGLDGVFGGGGVGGGGRTGDERDEQETLAAARAITQMPTKSAELLCRRYVENRTPRDIAAETGVSVATLRVSLHRARAALQQEYLRQYALAEATGDCATHVEAMLAVCGVGDGRKRRAMLGSKSRPVGSSAAHLASCAHCQHTISEIRHQRSKLTGASIAAAFGLIAGGLVVTSDRTSASASTVQVATTRSAASSVMQAVAKLPILAKLGVAVVLLGASVAATLALLGNSSGVEGGADPAPQVDTPSKLTVDNEDGACELEVTIADGVMLLTASSDGPGCSLSYQRAGSPPQPDTPIDGSVLVRTAIPGSYEITLRGKTEVQSRTVQL